MTLKEARTAAGMTQSAIAKKLNVRPSAVNHWENGRCSPCKKYRKKLAKLLGLNDAELEEILKGGDNGS